MVGCLIDFGVHCNLQDELAANRVHDVMQVYEVALIFFSKDLKVHISRCCL